MVRIEGLRLKLYLLAKYTARLIISVTDEAQLAYELIRREIPRKDFWYKKLWNINLPDAKDGYAVLELSYYKHFNALGIYSQKFSRWFG